MTLAVLKSKGYRKLGEGQVRNMRSVHSAAQHACGHAGCKWTCPPRPSMLLAACMLVPE